MTTIILLFLNLGCILFIIFFKSYFSEKGKRLAVKEDIEEITSKVEKIKTDFKLENDEIKAKLQHLLMLQLEYRNEERNTIVDFYKKYNDWLFSMLEINFNSYFIICFAYIFI